MSNISNAPSAFEKPRNVLNRRGFLGLSAAVAASGLVLSGCGAGGDNPSSGGTGGGAKKKIGFALATYTVPRYVKLDLPNFKKATEAAGYETVSLQADSNVDKQLEDVNNLLSQDIAALAVMPVSSEAGVTLARKAKAAGVPIIAYNQIIPSPDIAGFVARDNKKVGTDQVAAMKEFLGSLKGNVVICSGQAGDQVATDVTKGCMEALQPAIDSGDVKVVTQKYHDGWDPESARKQVEDALTSTSNNIAAVLSNNDGMAGAAIQALAAQGLTGKVFVCGQDATSEACKAIVLGEQQMSVFTPFDEMGKTAGDLSVKLAKGEQLSAGQTFPVDGGTVPFFPIPTQIINRDNVVEYVKKYSPDYVDAKIAFGGVPKDKLPQGAAELLQ